MGCARGEGEDKVFVGVEVMVRLLGAGEMEEKPTRSLRLAPWVAETGLGAANWVPNVMDGVDDDGGIPGIEGLDETCVAGVAD